MRGDGQFGSPRTSFLACHIHVRAKPNIFSFRVCCFLLVLFPFQHPRTLARRQVRPSPSGIGLIGCPGFALISNRKSHGTIAYSSIIQQTFSVERMTVEGETQGVSTASRRYRAEDANISSFSDSTPYKISGQFVHCLRRTQTHPKRC